MVSVLMLLETVGSTCTAQIIAVTLFLVLINFLCDCPAACEL